MKNTPLKHRFVDSIPNDIKDNILYVTIKYATAVHLCCCGCGNEVVTPFSPKDWSLTFDGKSISLSPSIGNWNFPCRSHYWVKCDSVKWCERSKAGNKQNRCSDDIIEEKHIDTHPSKNTSTLLSSVRSLIKKLMKNPFSIF